MDEPDSNPATMSPAIDLDRLKRRAFHYLQRYAASEAQLAAVLRRRLARDARAEGRGLDEPEFGRVIAAVVARCRDLGFLDDRSFAGTKVASARRKGHSANRIARALAGKGVGADVIGTALSEEGGDERRAALVFLRRKRIGPFRRADGPDRAGDRAGIERRDLAMLCRNGFELDLARRVLRLSWEDAEAEIGAAA